MKKLLAVLLCGIILSTSVTVLAADSVRLIINGVDIADEMAAGLRVVGNDVLIPFGAVDVIAETLGVSVEFDVRTSTVHLSSPDPAPRIPGPSGVFFFEHEYVALEFVGFENHRTWGNVIVFNVQNRADITITFRDITLAVNGENLGTSVIAAESIAPQSIGRFMIMVDHIPSSAPERITGTFSIRDANDTARGSRTDISFINLNIPTEQTEEIIGEEDEDASEDVGEPNNETDDDFAVKEFHNVTFTIPATWSYEHDGESRFAMMLDAESDTLAAIRIYGPYERIHSSQSIEDEAVLTSYFFAILTLLDAAYNDTQSVERATIDGVQYPTLGVSYIATVGDLRGVGAAFIVLGEDYYVIADIFFDGVSTTEQIAVFSDFVRSIEFLAPQDLAVETQVNLTPSPAPTQRTVSQRNAIRSAENYLSFTAFSRTGLIGQLEFEGFSRADATYAVDNIVVDWYEQAALSAESYLEFMPFSRDGLIGQLVFDGFTREQAVFGVEANGF